MRESRILIAVSSLIWASACSLLPNSGSTPPPNPVGVVYPSDSGVINIQTAYGAKGDGVTDDTPSIQNAVSGNLNSPVERVLYFPNGVYRVTQPLVWKDASGNWGGSLSLQGQSQTGTVIQLADAAPGFGDPATPHALITTALTAAPGSLFSASANNISDLTIDTGAGNPGAVGIDYAGSNQCVIRNTAIQAADNQGVAGLQLVRASAAGPCLYRNITVQGFDTGVLVQNEQPSATFTELTLVSQKVVGFHCSRSPVQIDQLTSNNSVPAILNDDPALGIFSLDHATLSGGSSSAIAISNINGARMYAHDLKIAGYGTSLKTDSAALIETPFTWTSLPIMSLFTAESHSLDLPFQDAPLDLVNNNFRNWANVRSPAYGNCQGTGDDCTAAIQAAIDSGNPVIYFPFGSYSVSNTIHVRGNAQRLIGFGAEIAPTSGFPADQAGFRIESTLSSPVTLERMRLSRGASSFPIAVQDAASSQTTLILRDINLGQSSVASYQTQTGGPLYIEDLVGSSFVFDNQTVWARQLDLETGSNALPVLVTNNGGKVWISGLKVTEHSLPSTVVQTLGGGETEILGATVFPSSQVAASLPAFISQDSEESLVYSVGGIYDFEVNVQETRASTTSKLYRWNSTSSPNAFGSATIPSGVPLVAGF